jgi:hypothetical protein
LVPARFGTAFGAAVSFAARALLTDAFFSTGRGFAAAPEVSAEGGLDLASSLDMAARSMATARRFFLVPAAFGDDAFTDCDGGGALGRTVDLFLDIGLLDPAPRANASRTPLIALAPTCTAAPATDVITPPIVEMIPVEADCS